MHRSNAAIATIVLCGALAACTPQTPPPQVPPEEPPHADMPHQSLLLAQLDNKEKSASGTGIFFLDPVKQTLQYRLTYQGLTTSSAKRIALYNSGAGKDGPLVASLCGEDTKCPDGPSATMTGRIVPDTKQAIEPELAVEIFSERVYVAITGAQGDPEMRGQLLPHSAMVPFANFIAEVKPVDIKTSQSTGTAIGSETYFSDGTISVLFAGTFAGLSGPPTGVALATGPSPKDKRIPLPQVKMERQRSKDGATILAIYQVAKDAPDAPLISRLRAQGYRQTGLVVMTEKYPDGEAYGVLEPQR